MNYRQLQTELKTLRTEGKIPATFKLNQKKVILQAVWDEFNIKYNLQQELFDDADRFARQNQIEGSKVSSTLTLAFYNEDGSRKYEDLTFEKGMTNALKQVAEMVETYNVTDSLIHVPVTTLNVLGNHRTELLTYAA